MADKTMHEAFAEAYAEMNNPKKNANNPAFRSKYANLEELLNVTRPVLAAEGFSLIQEPVSEPGCVGVHTSLHHRSGDSLDFGFYVVPLAKMDAQGAGSAITYCRRYAIAAIFGLAQEDDDGNAASNTRSPAPASNAPVTPQDAPGAAQASDATNAPKAASKAQIAGILGFVKDLGYDNADAAAVIHEQTGRENAKVGTTAKPGNLTHAEAQRIVDYLTKVHAERKAKVDADMAAAAEKLGGSVLPE